MADVTLPQLGETVTEGTITQWFKNVGDTVAEDEPLFEVSTDKVDTEVPSPIAGVLTEIRVPEGDTVDVGAVIAVVLIGIAYGVFTEVYQGWLPWERIPDPYDALADAVGVVLGTGGWGWHRRRRRALASGDDGFGGRPSG